MKIRSRLNLSTLVVGIAGALFISTAARSQLIGGIDGDPAVYIGAAQALASGMGYQFNGLPETTYPPGLSLLLTPVVAVFGADVDIAQGYIGFWAFLALLAIVVYLRLRGDVPVLLITGMLLMSSVFYNSATVSLRTEMPYIAFSVGCLAVMEHCAKTLRPRFGAILIGALFVAWTIATRTVGIALPAAMAATAVQQIWRAIQRSESRPRMGIYGITIGVGVLYSSAWAIWSRYHAGRETAYGQLGRLLDPHQPDLGMAKTKDLLLRPIGRFLEESAHLGELFTNLPWLKPLWFSPLIVVLLILIVLGWRREFGRDSPLAAWYAGTYLTIVLFWPFDEGGRFLLPVLPLLFIFMISGARALTVWFNATDLTTIGHAGSAIGLIGLTGSLIEAFIGGELSKQNLAAICGWGSILVGSTAAWKIAQHKIHSGVSISRTRRTLIATYLSSYIILGAYAIQRDALANVQGRASSPAEGLRAASSWIIANTKPEDLIMAEHAAGIHFNTGRRTIRLPVTSSQDRLLAAIEAGSPTYLVILNPPENPYYVPTEVERLRIIERGAPQMLRLVYEYPAGRIFQLTYEEARGRR